MVRSFLLTAMVLAAPAPKEPPAKPGNLVGEWEKVGLSAEGAARDPKGPILLRFDPDGKVYIRGPGEEPRLHATYTVDPSATRPAIDVDFDPGAAGPSRFCYPGIFKADGDTLTICLGHPERG